MFNDNILDLRKRFDSYQGNVEKNDIRINKKK